MIPDPSFATMSEGKETPSEHRQHCDAEIVETRMFNNEFVLCCFWHNIVWRTQVIYDASATNKKYSIVRLITAADALYGSEGKRCAGCGITKSPEQFNARPSTKSGRRSRCRDCERQACLDRRSRKGIPPRPFRKPDEHGRYKCKRCEQWLTPDRYGAQPESPSGLKHVCKTCLAQYQRETYHNKASRLRKVLNGEPTATPT
jgi:hypothetical protein